MPGALLKVLDRCSSSGEEEGLDRSLRRRCSSFVLTAMNVAEVEVWRRGNEQEEEQEGQRQNGRSWRGDGDCNGG